MAKPCNENKHRTHTKQGAVLSRYSNFLHRFPRNCQISSYKIMSWQKTLPLFFEVLARKKHTTFAEQKENHTFAPAFRSAAGAMQSSA